MKNKKETKFWNSFSKNYDKFISKFANETYSKIKENIISEVNINDNLIEIGSGTGIFTFYLAKHVKHITATDFAYEMIKISKEKQKELAINNITFQTEDVTNLSFDDNTTDVIIAVNVLHLIENPELAMSEIKRVLNKNGKLIIPTYCHGQNLISRLISLFMSLGSFKMGRRWSTKSFRKFIENSGFEIEKELIFEDKIPLSYIVALKK